jgi:UDP-2,4-diacetamido-2,4,6-trideoxy-beta-L-altropyranose hydrolase
MKPVKVAIRADASVRIGSGHLMRCLTLARKLRDSGCQVIFISRSLPGNLLEQVGQAGFPVRPLSCRPGESEPGEPAGTVFDQDRDSGQTAAVLAGEGGVDWLVADHYGIDERWERPLRRHAGKIMVIDDLANRRHDCDLLLDQNLCRDPVSRYRGLLPDSCLRLIGPAYLLLRQEFIEARRSLRTRDGRVRRILVSFGGSDPTNETSKVLTAWQLLDRRDMVLDLVPGAGNPLREELLQRCQELEGVNCLCQGDDMAQLMARADLAIGAGGVTAWERCYLGLPALIIAVADNQVAGSRELARRGGASFLGMSSEVPVRDLVAALETLAAAPDAVRTMGRHAFEAVGLGSDDPAADVALAIMAFDQSSGERCRHAED